MKAIGIDAVAMRRFEHMVMDANDGFIERVFTARERKYCAGSGIPFQAFAAHYAAKEALRKAVPSLRHPSLDWRELEVLHTEQDTPSFVMNPFLKERLDQMSASSVLLSISHTHDTAVAMVAIV